MKNRYLKTKYITVVSVFSALSSVFMFFSFSIPIFPSFLKLDISEIPALIVSFALGPFYGVCVVLIKNIVNLFFTSSGGIGELANFIVGTSFVYVSGVIYERYKTKKSAIFGMTIGTTVMSAVGLFANYYLLFPLYYSIMPVDSIINMFKSFNPYIDSVIKIMFFSILTFNLFKGALISMITFLIYKKISIIIKNF